MAGTRSSTLGIVLVLLASGTALTVAPTAGLAEPCEGYRFVPAQGPSCPVPGGWLVETSPGLWEPTHGPDYPGPGGDPPEAPSLAAPSDPICVESSSSDYYQHLIYAQPSDRTNRHATIQTTIRDLTRTVNGFLNDAATESGGGFANYKVLCSGGTMVVSNAPLPTPTSSATYSTITSDLRNLGYSSSRAAYWVWYDGPMSGACGQATLHQDTSLSSGNANNFGNDFAILYATTSGCTHSRTWMHENAHTSGAVQNGAPATSGAGHCNDGLDHLCVQDGGPTDCNTGGFYCENTCFDKAHFDCQHNTYFHTNPAGGSWLATRWNLGNPLNRFYSFANPGNPLMQLLSCTPNPSNASQAVTCSFRATDDSSGVHYTVNWGDGSPATRVPASGTVVPNTTQTATHAWSSNGGYTVSVTATDNGAPPLTSAAMTLVQTVGPVCSLSRSGVLYAGLAGVDVPIVSGRTEASIPVGCGGRTYLLTGEHLTGPGADFDVCWLASGVELRCDEAGGFSQTGTIPVGTTDARIVLFLGAFARYQLTAPV